jgi:hypothetical protein
MPNASELMSHGESVNKTDDKAAPAEIAITLAYAPTAEQQYYEHLQVAAGTTLYEALVLAGWLQRFPLLAAWCEAVHTIETPTAKIWHVGIYSHKQPLNYVLKAQDRIEVYRTLKLDPMGKRKNRAIKKQQSQ